MDPHYLNAQISDLSYSEEDIQSPQVLLEDDHKSYCSIAKNGQDVKVKNAFQLYAKYLCLLKYHFHGEIDILNCLYPSWKQAWLLHCRRFHLSATIVPYYRKLVIDNLHLKKLQLNDTLNDGGVKDEDIDMMEEYF